jgi:antitoxin component YwqK of YwqJK toxin-antitoxin module
VACLKYPTLLHSAFLCTALCAAPDDYLNYKIPVDSVTAGPHPTRDPDQQEFYYFTGAEKTRENLVAIEVFDQDVLIRRELMKHGKKHGMQMEWHPNGKPKKEAPYKDGSMKGMFRDWDESGNLVGQYTMSGGTGTILVYSSTGKLVKEDHYKSNEREGLRMERIGDMISFTWWKDGHITAKGCDYFESGAPAAIGVFSEDGVPNGPFIEFTQKGDVRRASWYLRGREVDAPAYQKAQSTNPSLPPYFPNTKRYKETAAQEAGALVEKYRRMPRVKIPLQFDREGRPLPAK